MLGSTDLSEVRHTRGDGFNDVFIIGQIRVQSDAKVFGSVFGNKVPSHKWKTEIVKF